MSCVVAVLVFGVVVKAYRLHEKVQLAVRAESLARELGQVLSLSAKERGVAALLENDAEGVPDREALAALRAELDRRAATVLSDTRALAVVHADTVLAALVEGVDTHRRDALAERAALERASSGAERVVATDRWIASMTQLDEALLVLHGALLQDAAEHSPRLHELAHLRQASLAVAEHAGQERAILGVALARGEVVSDERLEDLHRRRGVVEHSLEDLEAYLRPRPPPPELQPSMQRMRRDFLEQLAGARATAYRCVSAADPCALTAAQWFAEVTAGIDAVVGVSETASDLARAEIASISDAATRSLLGTAIAGSCAFALIVFASSFVRRRIGQRLLDLRDGALLVAKGELEHPVVVPGSDEISAVAHAVEQMRATLGRRNLELRQLVDRLKEAQGQLVQQERLASVGHLAGGVAHEINNPLSIVLGNVVHLLDQLDKPGTALPFDRAELRDVLLEVREATERSTAIVRDLRDFGSGSPGTSGRMPDLDEAVESVVTVLRGSFPRDVRVQTDLSAPIAVVGSRSALAQVLQRLLDNAREACAAGGVVTVRTRHDQRHAMLSVEDDGAGIAPESLERVFEPFFTTKRRGRSTGLGLSVCLGIVRQLGGDLNIDSDPGRGTVVTVKLPLAA